MFDRMVQLGLFRPSSSSKVVSDDVAQSYAHLSPLEKQLIVRMGMLPPEYAISKHDVEIFQKKEGDISMLLASSYVHWAKNNRGVVTHLALTHQGRDAAEDLLILAKREQLVKKDADHAE